jgi:hypothetical protein
VLGRDCGHAPYTLIYGKSEIRVQFAFERADAEENKWFFDNLFHQQDEIEAAFGDKIEWLRLDDKKASRLQYAMACDGYDRERWPEYIAWHVEHIQKWEKALRGPIAELNQALKARGASE